MEKPAQWTAILLVLWFSAFPLGAQAQNDECAQAIAVGEGIVAGSNVGSTTSSQSSVCPLWVPAQPQNDVWYLYTPSCSATARASLLGQDGGGVSYIFGTLAAYTGTCPTLTKIACAGTTFFQPVIDFPVTAGVPVFISVGSTSVNVAGAFTLSIQCFSPVLNDECATATLIGEGTFPGSNVFATASPSNQITACPPYSPIPFRDVWYRYMPSATGVSLISLCPCDGGGASFYPVIGAFSGDCATGLTNVACLIANPFGAPSHFYMPVTSGVPILISIDSLSQYAGTFTLAVANYPAVTNDECSQAVPITDGVTPGHNFGATASGLSGICAPMTRDVWYQYTPAATGVARFSTCAADGGSATFAPQIMAFGGPCPGLTPQSCGVSSCPPSGAKIAVPVVQGVPILVAIGSSGGQEGSFQLAVSSGPALVNDSCPGALPVSLGVNGPFDNTLASDDGIPASSCIGPAWLMQSDVWFAFTSPVTGDVRVETCGATFVTHVLVFNACAGSQVACGPLEGSICQTGTFLTFFAVQGVTYQICVEGFQPASGQFHLRLSGPYVLAIDAPTPGALRVRSHTGTPFAQYFTGATLVAGAFPDGPFFGIDLPLVEAMSQFAWGYPFTGTLDANGASPVLLIPGGVAPGITLRAVSVTFDPAGSVLDVSAPVLFTTS